MGKPRKKLLNILNGCVKVERWIVSLSSLYCAPGAMYFYSWKACFTLNPRGQTKLFVQQSHTIAAWYILFFVLAVWNWQWIQSRVYLAKPMHLHEDLP
jgi:hypothetical protein